MKKLVAIFAFMASVNLFAISQSEFNAIQNGCYNRGNFSLCKTLCDLNDGKGCNKLGIIYLKGQGVTKNLSIAIKLYEKACDLKYPSACSNLGGLYRFGYDFGRIKQDHLKAIYYYEIACNALNDGFSCLSFGEMYENGQGVAKNTNKAFEFYSKACDLGNKDACKLVQNKQNIEPVKNFDEQQGGEKSEIWTILFGLLDKALAFALSFLVVGGLFKVLLWGAWKAGLAKNKDLFANKTATSAYIILSVLVAILGPKNACKGFVCWQYEYHYVCFCFFVWLWNLWLMLLYLP